MLEYSEDREAYYEAMEARRMRAELLGENHPLVATPFEEDCAVTAIAERAGLTVERRESIEIADPAAIEAAGLTRKTPDYSRIRRLMADGVYIPGVQLTGVEYVLRRRGTVAETSNERR